MLNEKKKLMKQINEMEKKIQELETYIDKMADEYNELLELYEYESGKSKSYYQQFKAISKENKRLRIKAGEDN